MTASQGTSASPAVRIEDVSKRFRIYHHRNQSLKGAILQRSRGVYEDFYPHLGRAGVLYEFAL